MSSILEALKKLEAEKSGHMPGAVTSFEEPTHSGGGTLLDDSSAPATPSRNMPALLWVLGGGIFTLMIIGVVVLLLMLALQQGRSTPSASTPSASTPSASTPSASTPSASTSVAARPTPPPTTTITIPTVTPSPATPSTNTETSVAPEAKPVVVSPAPTPPPEHITPAVVAKDPAPVQETRPLPPTAPKPSPRPAKTIIAAPSSAPVVQALPSDIRSLPMLSRNERSQYRLEGVRLNMLNPAGPTRPLGNAFINLEKVFIGEFLPGSNAKLIGVAGHGIAIEIQSTRQRYYMPR